MEKISLLQFDSGPLPGFWISPISHYVVVRQMCAGCSAKQVATTSSHLVLKFAVHVVLRFAATTQSREKPYGMVC